MELRAEGRQIRFLAEVLAVRDFATLGIVKQRLTGQATQVLPLLIAPYLTRALSERCRVLDLPFMDTAGNVYIRTPELVMNISGEPRPESLQAKQKRPRLYTDVGMKLTFALLCNPELAEASQRQLAEAGQVALGAVGPVLNELQNAGFLVKRRTMVLTRTKELLEQWVMRYPETLRPKLFRKRYSADVDRLLHLRLPPNAQWSGEVAAQRLTDYLRPERFSLYVMGSDENLLNEGRMRHDANGNIEILDAFWNFPSDPSPSELVPPLLAYADLMGSHSGRNLEAAKLLYERHIAPTLSS